ncbi:DUF4058 family protein [Zavarzinella formosa]|uniref:DUF4058 family protein n=1 Tax=Zavarzinella formosa TaxID=360055 RepID=UPI0003692794|nr:DUF4058 family protein [Zavarzinella formosa]
MPSPFPGMDPWLEDSEVFPDFHNRLAILLSEAINARLPSGYVATSASRVWVSDDHMREPDVSLYGRGAPRGGGVAVMERPGVIPVGRPVVLEPMTETFLEIRSTRGRRLITAVEILSLSNKLAGNGRTAYGQKQDEFVLGGVCLVEIDLLRSGAHTTLTPVRALREQANTPDYHVSILRPWADDGHGDIGVVPVRLREPLPAIPIPLEAGMPDVYVELQPLLDHCYDSGRYADLTDYRADPTSPLSDDQREWAEAILRDKGLRA